ncbi:MAG: LpxD N-terminal domain-containing protein, partial [Deltaproteobacteria bacterium]
MNIKEKLLREIASLVGGRLANEGRDSQIKIQGMGSIFHAKKGDVTYLSERAYLPHLSRTEASAVLVSEELDLSIPQVIVSNPKLAFAKMMALFTTFPALPSGVSSLSFKEEDVEIGRGVTIGPFVYLGKGAKIGDGVILYPGVFVGSGVSIDSESVIYPNVVLYPDTSVGKRVIVHAGS